LGAPPSFKQLKKNKLPRPFARMGGSRIQSSGLVKVSDEHTVLFIWRDGEIRTDAAFYAYLLCSLREGDFSVLLEFHFHPSHKGCHCKTPCRTTADYTNRLLPGAPELNLSSPAGLDPRSEADRLKLIHCFCKACGIGLAPEHDAQGQSSLGLIPR
jgi:hypothetical protein